MFCEIGKILRHLQATDLKTSAKTWNWNLSWNLMQPVQINHLRSLRTEEEANRQLFYKSGAL